VFRIDIANYQIKLFKTEVYGLKKGLSIDTEYHFQNHLIEHLLVFFYYQEEKKDRLIITSF
jgi:hypothetical protein